MSLGIGIAVSPSFGGSVGADHAPTLLMLGSDAVLLLDAAVAAGSVNTFRQAQLNILRSADLLLSAGGV